MKYLHSVCIHWVLAPRSVDRGSAVSSGRPKEGCRSARSFGHAYHRCKGLFPHLSCRCFSFPPSLLPPSSIYHPVWPPSAPLARSHPPRLPPHEHLINSPVYALVKLSLLIPQPPLGDATQNRIMQATHGPIPHQNGYANYVQNGHQHPPQNNLQNGHPQNHHQQAPSHRNAPQPQQQHKEPVAVLGIPSVTVQDGELVVGDAQSSE